MLSHVKNIFIDKAIYLFKLTDRVLYRLWFA